MSADAPARPASRGCAIVTGGASGMGLAHAAALLADGFPVAITDVRMDALDAAAAELGSADLLAIRADNRNAADIRRAVALATERFGWVEVLVNNAGISGKRLPIETIDETAFDAMYAIHVRGAFLFSQAVVADMKARRCGSIVNISSHFAMVGSNGASHYTAAKAALHGLTRALAVELAPWNIRVNTVCPALVDTPLTRDSLGEDEIARQAQAAPMGRIASTQEVAASVAWLAGTAASAVTGQVIAPNAGIAIVGI